MNETQPIVGFLAPADAQTTSLCQPAKRTLNDPTARGKLGFTGDGAVLQTWLAPASAVLDVCAVVFGFNKFVNIGGIIAFVHTNMLFHYLRLRTDRSWSCR